VHVVGQPVTRLFVSEINVFVIKFNRQIELILFCMKFKKVFQTVHGWFIKQKADSLL